MAGYLARMLAALFGLLGAVAGFNAFMDPYGHFGPPRFEGINARQLGFNHRLRLGKALAVDRLRPATVIVGNSRAEAGYDPAHPGLAPRPAYNLAMGGSGMGEARRYLLEAVAAGRLRHVILALDYTMFDAGQWQQDQDGDGLLLTDAEGRPAGPGRHWRRLGLALLSGTALSDSLWSLSHQRRPVADYRPDGLRDEAADLDQVVREGGHRRASRRVEATFLAGTLRDVESPDFRARYGQTFDELRAIAALAASRGIRLVLVLNPIHARHNQLFAAAGLWPAYERWKRDVAALAGASGQVAVWDFSGVSPCTAEAMPGDGEAGVTMRWYRETAHFRRALGDRVLDRLAGAPAGECAPFGERLDGADLDALLARQRRDLAAWAATHPADVAEIDADARHYGRRP